MVLFAIIKSVLTNSGQWTMKDEKTPLGIIKMTLIAGILIQASRFLVAATVDISTVATYAVGGLPLSVLKNTDIGNQKILSVSSSIDLNKFEVLSEEWENFKVWYSTNYKDGNEIKKVEFSPCRIEEWYIVGRQYKEARFRNDGIFGSGQSACVALGNQIVIYNEFPNVADKQWSDYKNEIDRILWAQDDWKPREACGYIIKVWWKTSNLWTCDAWLDEVYQNYIAQLPEGTNDDMKVVVETPPTNTNSDSLWLSGWATRFNGDNVIATTMSELIKKSKWFVGPLVTIYSSLLNFAQLTDTSVTTIGETSGIFIIKTAVAIALFFPLLALAVVLIMRIGILRLYIVASPFIVLKACFKDFIKMEKLDKYLDIKGVIWIIFAPVVTVAALSISLIFMTALVNGFTSSSSVEMNQTFGTQKITAIHTGNDAISFNNVAEIEFTKLPWWEAMDWFSRLMVNFFAIGLMWMIVFAAIKANEIGKWAGQKIQDFGQNFFQTMPILPIGEWGSRVGVGSAAKVLNAAPDTRVRNKESEQTQVATDFVWWNQTGWTTATTIDTTWANSLINENTTAESIKSWLKEKWIEDANMSTVLTSSYASLYEAVNKITEPDKKQSVITAIADAWAGKDREKTYEKTKAKTELDIFITSKAPADKNALSTIFTNASDSDKTIIEKYLTKTWDTYTTTVADTEYTIKRTDTWNPPVISYSVTP